MREIEEVVRRVEKIETAIEPRFQEHFVAAMGIPHATEPYPRLAAAVDLRRSAHRRGADRTRPRATRVAADAATRRRHDPHRPRGAPHERRHDRDPADGAPAAAPGGRPRGSRRRRGVPFITRTLKPFEVCHDEGLALIEHNADTILEEVGIDFRDYPDALELLTRRRRRRRRRARAVPARDVPADRAGHRAAEFTQHARNPEHNVQIGGDATVFAPNYGSPFVHDLDGGRRYGTIEDFQNFVKLAYASPYLHHSGGTVCEPVDLPVNKRHLDMVYAHMRYSDKPFMGSVTHPQRAEDSVEHGADRLRADDLEDRTVMTSLINASSPLVWDATMLGAAQVYAEANQATIITPFILAGAMAPATSAGVAAQTLAEALAGMAFVQLVRPGAPGGVRLVRVVDVDADGRARRSARPSRRSCSTRCAAARAGSACRSARGGSLARVEAARRAGGVRVGEHAAADGARRRQLRPARRGLARGRPGDRLREVRDRRRPARA